MEDQIRSKANVNYWKMQDQTLLSHKNERAGKRMTGKCRTQLKVTFIGAVVRCSGCKSRPVPLVIVAVNDTLLYF